MPIASTILMVRPAAFGFNDETAANNHFQTKPGNQDNLHQTAIEEFDGMVAQLRAQEIKVIVIDDTPIPPKPDALFPNNWLSTTPSGLVNVFPLYAHNRRPEKRQDIIGILSGNFLVRGLQDWSEYEVEGKFLEGTGSMVIDHDNKMIYACISERTSLSLLEKYASANGYQALAFVAKDMSDQPVYHTNVVMALGDTFCVLCEDAISEEWELIAVRQLLESTGHEIITITHSQMHQFAGNILQVLNTGGEKFIILSATAMNSLTTQQKRALSAFGKLLPIAVPTIEEVEGGSVRCMMAEIFLTEK